jgi:transposase
MPKSKYSKEFKIRAVRLSEQDDVTCVEIAEDLDLSVQTLYEWRQQYKKHGDDAFPGSGNQTPENQRIAELERKVNKLQNERDILKKAMSIFAD